MQSVSSYIIGAILVYHSTSCFQQDEFGMVGGVISVDGKHFLSLSDRLRVRAWRTEDARPMAVFEVKKSVLGLPRGIALHPFRQTAIIADTSGFIEWDWTKKPAANKPVFSDEANSKESIQDSNNTLSLDISSDSKMLAIVDSLGNVKIQAIPSGKPKIVGKVRFGGSSAMRVKFIAGSKFLCAVDIENVQIFDCEKCKPIATLTKHKQPIDSLDVAHDGKTIATASVDGSVIVWDFEKRKAAQTTQLKKGDNLRVALKFSPDGALLACEQDSTISLFRTKDLTLVSRWNGPKSGASEILITKDNRIVITLGEGLAPRYWDIALKKERIKE